MAEQHDVHGPDVRQAKGLPRLGGHQQVRLPRQGRQGRAGSPRATRAWLVFFSLPFARAHGGVGGVGTRGEGIAAAASLPSEAWATASLKSGCGIGDRAITI